MWRKNVTSCVMETTTLLIGILTRNILNNRNQPEVSMTSGSKVMAQIVVFVFLVTVTLTFDLCSIVCHTHCAWYTGICMRSFIRIRPVILGDMPWTHTHTHTQPPKVILIVSQNARLNMVLKNMWNLQWSVKVFSSDLSRCSPLLYKLLRYDKCAGFGTIGGVGGQIKNLTNNSCGHIIKGQNNNLKQADQ